MCLARGSPLVDGRLAHGAAAVVAAFLAAWVFTVGHGVSRYFIVQQFPEYITAYQAAGGDLAARTTRHFGDEAHACARYLLCAYFLFRVHTIAFCIGCVVECAQAFQFDGTAIVHVVSDDASKKFDRAMRAGAVATGAGLTIKTFAGYLPLVPTKETTAMVEALVAPMLNV